MIIYRVQDSDGNGPYTSRGESFGWRHWTRLNKDNHPNPTEDIGRDIRRDEKCGFANLIALRSWFTSAEIKTMTDNGFVIAAYLVPNEHVTFGKRQVLFVSEHATKIEDN